MLTVFFRWSARANHMSRPSWYSDLACAQNALATFGRRPQQTRVILITDGTEPDDSILDLPWDDWVSLPARTNSAAFMRCLDFALEQEKPDQWLYFLEQDYLHLPAALHALEDGFVVGPADYLTQFDDPLYYWPSRDCDPVDKTTEIHVGLRHHWRRVPSTTMTFASPHWVAAEDRMIFEKTLRHHDRPPDQRLWGFLAERRALWCPVPGMSTHVERTALAPFVDWRGLGTAERAVRRDESWPISQPIAGGLFDSVPEIAVSDRIQPDIRRRLARLVPRAVIVTLKDVVDPGHYSWIAVSAEEKEALDTNLRNRASRVRGVIVCGVAAGSFQGRWFSGRDWFLDDILEGGGNLCVPIS